MSVGTSTVYIWRRRYRAEGLAALRDRSSRSNASPTRMPGDADARVIYLRRENAIAFLKVGVVWYASLGIAVDRGHGRQWLVLLFLRPLAKPAAHCTRDTSSPALHPKTNVKAKRFIQSSLREWAHAQAYENSEHGTRELPCWLQHYNWHGPHPGINAKQPVSRSGSDGNNIMRPHS